MAVPLLALLLNLPQAPLLGLLGGLVIAFGLHSVLGLQGHPRISRWWALPASHVHVGISNRDMRRLIGALLLVSGTSLLWKAWH